MTKIDLNTIIPNLLANVDFHHYLLTENYNVVENVSYDKAIVYHKEDILFEEMVYITSVDGQQNYYSSTFTDSGNLIDFVKNRIEIDGTYEEFNPKKNNLIEACKKLLLFLNNVDLNNADSFDLKSIKQTDFLELQKKTYTYFYEALPISNFKYLKSKGITEDAILHPYFLGKIYNTTGLSYDDKSYDIINTSFPLYNETNKEIGLSIMNSITLEDEGEEDITLIVPGSDDKKGFWISNKVQSDMRSKPKLTLVDDPIEALSHFQIYDEERLYLSFFSKTEKAFDVIYSLIKKHNANFYLSSNVTLDNIIYDLRLILYVLGKDHSISFKIEHSNSIEITIKNSPHLKMFMERTERINNRIIKGVISALGNNSKYLLENDIIRASRESEDTFAFRIPKSLQMLYETTKNIVSTFPSNVGIITEKSTLFSWQELSVKHPKQSVEKLIKDTEIFGFKNI